MNTTQLKVKFLFEGNNLEEREYLKKAAMYHEEYMEAYNGFCSVANNGLIDALNKKWDEIHPGEYDNEDYEHFFVLAYNIAVKRMGLHTKHIPSFEVGSDLQVIGNLQTGGKLTFYLVGA